MKLHVFATKHKAITYHKFYWWLCPILELAPTEVKFMTSYETQQYTYSLLKCGRPNMD